MQLNLKLHNHINVPLVMSLGICFAVFAFCVAVVIADAFGCCKDAMPWYDSIIPSIAATALSFVLPLLYLFPAYVAFRRNAESKWAVFVANIFLGWTVILWLVCLIWSTMMPVEIDCQIPAAKA